MRDESERHKAVREVFIESEHTKNIALGLLYCQLVEEVLKRCLRLVYEIVRLKLTDAVPFRFELPDIEKQSLTQLLKIFKRHSQNEKLIEELNKLPEGRNYLAHQAFLASISVTMEEDSNLDKEKDHVLKILDLAARCMDRIVDEEQKLQDTKEACG